ncbi:zinc ribbon domain-containing protein [Planctomycetota bacterium]
MWKCKCCDSTIDVDFEVCWKCGTSREGVPDPDFVAETECAPRDEPVRKSLEDEISDRFKCSKCAHGIPRTKRIATTGTGLTKLMDVQQNRFLVVSCTNCGYSELYDANVLGARSGISDILDFLFGG